MRGIKSAAILVVALALGYLVARQINPIMTITFQPKALPEESGTIPTPQGASPTALGPVAAIVLPAGSGRDELYRRAGAELAEAILERSGKRPEVLEGPARHIAGPIILVGAHSLPEPAAYPSLDDPDSFAWLPSGTGSARKLVIVGGSRRGDVYGLYRLADDLRTGMADSSLFSSARVYSPAFKHRLVDLGGVGIPLDPSSWNPKNYSHHLRAFQEVFLPGPPYIDEKRFATAEAELAEYVQRMISYGNNGVVFNGFLEFVDFDRVGQGTDVYPADSAYRQQHLALRRHFGRLFRYAHDMGMDIYLNTDMLALTPPLESYLRRRFQRIDVSRPELWEVYRLGLEDLFDVFPDVDGLIVRIGEAGSIYNLPGWDYTSALYVKTDKAVRAMLTAFLKAAEAKGRDIIFRTWSVGVGQVGEMHTNPSVYDRVLGGLNSPRLLVSTKYIGGDFYSFLPFNPTLKKDGHLRLVEMQNRLEFEGFMAFPDYIAPLHRQALQELRRANPLLEGLWQWNQYGGPQQAGPMSIYPFYGFWTNIDANAYGTSRAAWEPDADVVRLTEAWVRRTFGSDPDVVRNLTRMLFLSRQAVRKGLYLSAFAKHQVHALGLSTPPMMWIFEWDIVDSSSSVLSSIYFSGKGDVDKSVAEGFEAVDLVRQMKALVDGISPLKTTRPELLVKVQQSVSYELDLFETLALYRKAFLNYYRWLDTGRRQAYAAWRESLAGFENARRTHEASYGRSLDFPAYNFSTADPGLAHARSSRVMMRLARLWLAAMIIFSGLGNGWVQRRMPPYPGKGGVRALWLAWAAPHRLAGMAPLSRIDAWPAGIICGILIILSHLTFSSFRSSAYIILFVLMAGTFGSIVLVLQRRAGRPVLFTVFCAGLMVLSLPMAAVAATRGPLSFWYFFWTSAAFRTVFFSVSTAALAWMLAILYAALRRLLKQGVWAALGSLFLAGGGALAAAGLMISAIGLESSLTAFNNQMAILPLGLSMILGITTHLGIPSSLPLAVVGAGGILVIFGVLLSLTGRVWAVKRLD